MHPRPPLCRRSMNRYWWWQEDQVDNGLINSVRDWPSPAIPSNWLLCCWPEPSGPPGGTSPPPFPSTPPCWHLFYHTCILFMCFRSSVFPPSSLISLRLKAAMAHVATSLNTYSSASPSLLLSAGNKWSDDDILGDFSSPTVGSWGGIILGDLLPVKNEAVWGQACSRTALDSSCEREIETYVSLQSILQPSSKIASSTEESCRGSLL